jgi:hypothetical protein
VPLLRRLFRSKTILVKLPTAKLTYTILSLVSLIISSIPIKHTSILHHRHKAWSLGSKEREIIQRILKKGLRSKVFGITSPRGSLGRGK